MIITLINRNFCSGSTRMRDNEKDSAHHNNYQLPHGRQVPLSFFCLLFFERKTMRNHELRSFGRYREERRFALPFSCCLRLSFTHID